MAKSKKPRVMRACKCPLCVEDGRDTWVQVRDIINNLDNLDIPLSVRLRIRKSSSWIYKTQAAHKALSRLLAVSDERMRRMIAGVVSLLYDGDTYMFERHTGVSRHTLRAGLHDLMNPELDLSLPLRIRPPRTPSAAKAAKGRKEKRAAQNK